MRRKLNCYTSRLVQKLTMSVNKMDITEQKFEEIQKDLQGSTKKVVPRTRVEERKRRREERG